MLEREKRRKIRGDAETAGMLTAYEVSRLLRISYYTLLKWRRAGIGPPSVRFSRLVIRYPRRALQRYMLERIRNGLLKVSHLGGLEDHGKDS